MDAIQDNERILVFVSAIETAAAFTRPIYFIYRYHNSTTAVPGAATLFFVNRDGWALTCKHVTDLILAKPQLNQNFQEFSRLKSLIPTNGNRGRQLKTLSQQFNYTESSIVQIDIQFCNSFTGGGTVDFNVIAHPTLDLALIQFRNFAALTCTTFASFPTDTLPLKQGRSICRLGFPFAEFNHYQYDPTTDSIGFTNTGHMDTPRFPIEGMVTRFIGNQTGDRLGFELSTPGLKGQSGGPAFDTAGTIWGIQSSTMYHDLEFDKDLDVTRNGARRSA